MTKRMLRTVAVVGLVISALAATPASATVAAVRPDTWVGQVVRHDRHFDYRGSYCPKGTEACIMILANFRIVPLTPQAAAGLRRVAGGRAQLVGHHAPAPAPGHNGILSVRRVERA